MTSRYSLRFALALAGLSVASGCDVTEPPATLVGATFRLISVDGDSLSNDSVPTPVRYYDSPDGTYYVLVNRGHLRFQSDSMVEIVTDRTVFYPGASGETQLGTEHVHYELGGALLRIARSDVRWDTATVRGVEIEVRWKHDGTIPLGNWLYRRQSDTP